MSNNLGVRELNEQEIEAVAGASLKAAAVFVGGWAAGKVLDWLVSPGKQTIPEFLSHLD